MLKFLKDWTLPVAMLAGIIGFPLFSKLTFLTPALIFIMLLLTFSKIRPQDLKPKPLHIWLIVIQVIAAPLAYLLLRGVNEILAQAIMVCLICPTATSAAVITSKLGGSAASVSTYTFLINIVVSMIVPIMFPLIESHPEISFFQSFSIILYRVFLLLICPLIAAWLIQLLLPKVHKTISNMPDLAFYLWALALTIVTAQIISSFSDYSAGWETAVYVCIGTFIVCCLQFFVGKTLGSVYNDRISGGQSLGQKNTILAIWMAHTYLNPIAAVGPGFYVLWQNIVNSWQLWKKRKRDGK
ncbi:bile acid:sodium symporter family protein [Bacteroides sp. 224]|uniref:bile acid:sodium symporter family protein n=1 Tax=Bacteroides sp. 224 TaxID=2302936 RepID=UPI0013D84B0C|nr:transporter [Bacteroides sp. 224]NDV64510.1 transporter [Bacteroides sp. 224]